MVNHHSQRRRAPLAPPCLARLRRDSMSMHAPCSQLPPAGPEEPLAALGHWFGFHRFRAGQEDVVRRILAGQDVCVIMPTGAGNRKSPLDQQYFAETGEVEGLNDGATEY